MPKQPNPELPGLLMDAALQLLDERGDVTFSMRELAGRIGYSVTAVYRCYETRGHLLRQLILKLFEQLSYELIDPEGGTPLEMVGQVGERFLQWAVTHPGRFRLMFQHIEANVLLNPDEQLLARAGLKYLEHLLQEAVDRGELIHAQPEALAIVLFTSLYGLAALAIANRMEGTPGEDVVAFFRAHRDHWLGNRVKE